jgi:hypothetical protein
MSQTLIFFVVIGTAYVVITLATGEAAIDGQDEGIDRRKQPVNYWLWVSFFALLVVGAIVAIISLNSN